MKIKIIFFSKSGKKIVDDSCLFINKSGQVCEIITRGSNSFIASANPDISYTVKQI